MKYNILIISRLSSSWDSFDILKRGDFSVNFSNDFDDAFEKILKEKFDLFIAEEYPNDPLFKKFVAKVLNQIKVDYTKGFLICSTTRDIFPAGVIKEVLFSPVTPLDFTNALVKVLGLKARKSTRYIVRMHIEFRENESSFMQTCVSVNLSKNGMLIETTKKLPIGKTFYWTFQGAKEIEGLTVKGIVLNEAKDEKFSSIYKYGIKFLPEDEKALEKLNNFIMEKYI